MLPLAESGYFIAAVFAAVAAGLDLKYRRIPNELNYSFLAIAVVLSFLQGQPALEYSGFVFSSFLFAFFLYKLGAWAGGDTKFFTSLSAYLPLVKPVGLHHILALFLFAALLLVPALAVIHYKKILALRKELAEIAVGSLKPGLLTALASTALLLATTFFFPGVEIKLPTNFFLSFFAIYSFSFLAQAFSLISRRVLRKTIHLSKLREGEILAQSVYFSKGRIVFWSPPMPAQIFSAVIKFNPGGLRLLLPPPNPLASCLNARGVSDKEIKQLKKAGVNNLVVRRAVAFAPALAVSFVLVAWLV